MVHVHVRLLEVVRRNPTYGVIDKIQNAIIEMHVSLGHSGGLLQSSGGGAGQLVFS